MIKRIEIGKVFKISGKVFVFVISIIIMLLLSLKKLFIKAFYRAFERIGITGSIVVENRILALVDFTLIYNKKIK